MKKQFIKIPTLISGLASLITTVAYAGSPLWTYIPLTTTTASLTSDQTATIQYSVTNQSRKPHTLRMRPSRGIHASGCELSLGYHQSCTLTLTVDGGALVNDVLDGPVLCESANPLQCYQPSLANRLRITRVANSHTVLSASVNQLVLSVKGLTEYGVPIDSMSTPSGMSRIITISNIGASTINDLAIDYVALPQDTSHSGTCDTSTQLAVGASCTIVINPGYTATSDSSANPCSSGTEPTPGIVRVSASNAASISTQVLVLNYGCIYQGGYVFAFDDTRLTSVNVGGKVAMLNNQANNYQWGPNTPVVGGINEQSTAGTNSCNGKSDGACNTARIINSGLPSTAAQLCSDSSDGGFTDWYLPAICEMGLSTNGVNAGCGTTSTPTLQNIQSNLMDKEGTGFAGNRYWSSTENSSVSAEAWYNDYLVSTNPVVLSGNGRSTKNNSNNIIKVRCVRNLTD